MVNRKNPGKTGVEEVTKKFRTHVGWGRERVFEVINIRNESGEKPNGKKSDREIR